MIISDRFSKSSLLSIVWFALMVVAGRTLAQRGAAADPVPIFSDSGMSSVQLFLDSTIWKSTAVRQTIRNRSYRYQAYEDMLPIYYTDTLPAGERRYSQGPWESLFDEESTQQTIENGSRRLSGTIVLTNYSGHTYPPDTVMQFHWRDTMLANELRYGWRFIDARAYGDASAEMQRTLYRYEDGKPILKATSDVWSIEDTKKFRTTYVAFEQTQLLLPPWSTGSRADVESDTFGVVSVIDRATNTAQYLVLRPTDDALSVGYHTNFNHDEHLESISVEGLKAVRRRDPFDHDVLEQHVEASADDFDIRLKFSEVVKTTVVIPVRKGKLMLPRSRSKWFTFELQ